MQFNQLRKLHYKNSSYINLVDMCSDIYCTLYMPIPNSVLCKIYMWLAHVSPLVTLLTRGQVSPSQNDNTAAFVGVLIGGMVLGAVTVLLVGGIVCGVCKLR